ncbi:MAG: GNAT family N-acetyltransferase [Reichenbachiella sp.]|uniref:GNAT family N-acetyltransferase n=1 Tax=Reichenbachiella sp. TaxID=2184521 RepID=UPI0032984247
MQKATKADQSLVVDIIAESFPYNPSVLSILKNDKKEPQRMRALARYVFKTALRRNAIFLSTDRTGVAICYRFNGHKEILIDYWNQMVLAISAIGIERIFKVLKRDNYVKKQRPKTGDFMYFWFFGVSDEGKGQGAAHELQKAIFEEAKKENLPIYLETSIAKNKRVYERYGFEVYHTWNYISEGITLWFMRSK